MTNIALGIHNPFSERWSCLLHSHKKMGNKVLEFNGYKSNTIVSVELRLQPFTDHSGAQLQVGLMGYELELHFYDTRHAHRRWFAKWLDK